MTRFRSLGKDGLGLFFALGHAQTPIHAKFVVVVAIAYALSPVDLLPDISPFIGLADDVLLVPTLLALAHRLLPQNVREETTTKSTTLVRRLPWVLPVFGVMVLVLLAVISWNVWQLLSRS